MKSRVLVILGPTSSGKSALAVLLAQKFNGEVISADSRQVYRGLTIGTGKISKREMKGVPHHLLDVASPKIRFSADDYIKRARAAIDDILSRGKLPIIAGGTGFYVDALVGRIILSDVPPNPALRSKLEKKTVAELHTILKKRDPRRAQTIEPHNKRRIIRALEIANTKDSPLHAKESPLYDLLWIGIAPPMKILEKKITVRLSARIKKGMVSEAKRLHGKRLSYKRMKELGLEYRSLARVLQGEITLGEMEKGLQSAIRRYAIRQIRYWRRNKDIRWFKSNTMTSIEKNVRKWRG